MNLCFSLGDGVEAWCEGMSVVRGVHGVDESSGRFIIEVSVELDVYKQCTVCWNDGPVGDYEMWFVILGPIERRGLSQWGLTRQLLCTFCF